LVERRADVAEVVREDRGAIVVLSVVRGAEDRMPTGE
jgi:hypothetical protein